MNHYETRAAIVAKSNTIRMARLTATVVGHWAGFGHDGFGGHHPVITVLMSDGQKFAIEDTRIEA